MRNKLLVALFGVVFMLLIAAAAIDAPEVSTDSTDNTELSFSIKTVAICEEKPGYIRCHDELVVNCGNEEYILPKGAETVNCGDIALQMPPITAFAVFDKDWQDPRLFAG